MIITVGLVLGALGFFFGYAMFIGPLALGIFASFKTIESIIEKKYYTKNKWMACAVISLSLQPVFWLFIDSWRH